MHILEYLIVGVAVLLTISWIANLAIYPLQRAPANTVIAIYWCIEIITLILIGYGAVLYLILLMPLTVVICNSIHKHMLLGGVELALKRGHLPPPVSLPALFIVASVVLIPILVFIAYD